MFSSVDGDTWAMPAGPGCGLWENGAILPLRVVRSLVSVYVFSGLRRLLVAGGGDNEGLSQDETNSHAGISGHRFDISSHGSGPERARVHVSPCGGLITVRVQYSACSVGRASG